MGKDKVLHYYYDGLFELGDNVFVIAPLTPESLKINDNEIVKLTDKTKCVISEKYQIKYTGLYGDLQGNEAYFKYNVRCDINGHEVECHHIPEWLLEYSDSTSNGASGVRNNRNKKIN